MSLAAEIAARFSPPACDRWSVRVVSRTTESLGVTRGITDPIGLSDDCGAMITVESAAGVGYAATSDISREGLERAGHSSESRWRRRRCSYKPHPRRSGKSPAMTGPAR